MVMVFFIVGILLIVSCRIHIATSLFLPPPHPPTPPTARPRSAQSSPSPRPRPGRSGGLWPGGSRCGSPSTCRGPRWLRLGTTAELQERARKVGKAIAPVTLVLVAALVLRAVIKA